MCSVGEEANQVYIGAAMAECGEELLQADDPLFAGTGTNIPAACPSARRPSVSSYKPPSICSGRFPHCRGTTHKIQTG
ncbi:Os07g0119550 [Oryza sativa Japonica Group]|uniref:Os07g0119550 protein n=1 Tax=Oryza sativa subsp. japonica TaxID=39947 RepID=A0A0P0X1Q7_ORYSJ|nr:Os07g0119550 [Oryza sativa Japonica Group]